MRTSSVRYLSVILSSVFMRKDVKLIGLNDLGSVYSQYLSNFQDKPHVYKILQGFQSELFLDTLYGSIGQGSDLKLCNT